MVGPEPPEGGIIFDCGLPAGDPGPVDHVERERINAQVREVVMAGRRAACRCSWHEVNGREQSCSPHCGALPGTFDGPKGVSGPCGGCLCWGEDGPDHRVAQNTPDCDCVCHLGVGVT